MKLYFYILKRPYGKKPFVKVEECEAIEKPKTYYAVDRFPDDVYRKNIHKSDIGHISGHWNDLVVLTEPNAKLAKDIFLLAHNSIVEKNEKSLNKAKELLNAILEMEE